MFLINGVESGSVVIWLSLNLPTRNQKQDRQRCRYTKQLTLKARHRSCRFVSTGIDEKTH